MDNFYLYFWFGASSYPINQDHVNDVLTQPWFIILLGAILAVLMLSFGAMVFVKRKHMMMKQSALNTMRGEYIEKNSHLWRPTWGVEVKPTMGAKCLLPKSLYQNSV